MLNTTAHAEPATEAEMPGAALALMKSAFAAEPYPAIDVRRDRLDRLERALRDYSDTLVEAMSADFSYRSPHESRIYDITASLGAVRFARRNLKRWMKPRRVGMPLHLLPASGRIFPQPLGVVGIIAPWNFPVFMVVPPMATAFAAGNRVMVKPSELSPRTSDVLARMIGERFSPEEAMVINGGEDVARAFSELPFDHLLFTGSTAVGRKVALAAAKNLTPVTLELGGKSPVIVTQSADLNVAARRIAWGKAASAGQICVAPDYALVPRAIIDDFAARVLSAWQEQHPAGTTSQDYSAIISERHLLRLEGMIDEARRSGATVLQLQGAGEPSKRKLPPSVIVNPSCDLAVMQEEVFGPLLSLFPYDTRQEALDFVAARDRPLALYLFTQSQDDRDVWLRQSHSGGVCINDVIVHVGCDTLPFGGVGASGNGAYHGDRGFETFSHMKSIFAQRSVNGTFLATPPYGPTKRRIWKLVERIV
ncbi:coniferyl aldehyde dehydrogenase [Sedimentimonas flavescens]|uniref:coniferyl aldehyde dehydrogenase n=1 Tax=Sedimentimonas flavescens TaxID=2851012 RepID=UPI001F2ED7DB|nr:coniferyl aldehyde dehydrogenase [Sedimentimonas flavescens]